MNREVIIYLMKKMKLNQGQTLNLNRIKSNMRPSVLFVFEVMSTFLIGSWMKWRLHYSSNALFFNHDKSILIVLKYI